MGIVFGRTGTAEPPHQLLLKAAQGFEVRRYQSFCTASVEMKNGPGFQTLAKYIGVYGDPKNEASKPLAMTSPVITDGSKAGAGQSLAMTSPVIQSQDEDIMSFVLPFEVAFEDLPKPTDKRITLKQVPAKTIAAVSFSGAYSREACHERFKQLQENLRDLSLLQNEKDDAYYSVAQYHPPFTIPFFRKNEVWIQLDESNGEVKKLLQQTPTD
jgi:hypothetical protein